MKKNIINEDYSQFNDISLMEVREFFTRVLFRNLVEKYNILTLGDLFRQTDNGNLYRMMCEIMSSKSDREDLWKVIKGTVNLLKGKYLKEDLFLDENSTLEEISLKLGVSRWDIMRLEICGIVDLGELMEMVTSNSFSILYNQPRWIKERVDVLINKIRLVHDIYCPGKVNYNDYSQFNNMPLTEVQDFFTSTVFKYLINKFGVSNVGDLFTKDETGELYKLICEENMFRFKREDLCIDIEGTINLLKCKYLNKELAFDENTPILDCYRAFGISFEDLQKLMRRKVRTLGDLLEMAARDDFSELSYMSWRKERINIIINKAYLIYELFYNSKTDSNYQL